MGVVVQAGVCAALLAAAWPSVSCGTNALVVASWNVENLFDTEDDPTHDGDDGYTPRGWSRWTEARYALKLEHLSQVIAAMRPDILCLIEVENRRVLEDLTRVLRERQGLDYPVILHRDGGDHRGIDVAMIARYPACGTNWFCAVEGQRDVLACDFEVGGRRLAVLVNHWKSQLGKKEESDAIRTREAEAVRAYVDRLLKADPGAAVVVTGDFNDALDSPVLVGAAGFVPDEAAARARAGERVLYNLAGGLPEGERGTYYYSPAKQWNALDSMSVSPGMLAGAGVAAPWRVRAGTYRVFKFPAHVSEQSGVPQPFRRVRSKEVGDVYLTGYSDHFPIRVELEAPPQATAAP